MSVGNCKEDGNQFCLPSKYCVSAGWRKQLSVCLLSMEIHWRLNFSELLAAMHVAENSYC